MYIYTFKKESVLWYPKKIIFVSEYTSNTSTKVSRAQQNVKVQKVAECQSSMSSRMYVSNKERSGENFQFPYSN